MDVRDGPLAPTSLARGTAAIAGRLSSCPGPASASAPVADVRPIIESRAELEL